MRKKRNGLYYGKVIVGRTPEGKAVRRSIQAQTSVEFLKLRYQLRHGIVTEPTGAEAATRMPY